MKDRVKVTGRVMVEWLENGVVVKRKAYRNKVTALGLALYASLIAGSGLRPSYIALGTSYADPTEADLTLGAEIARAPIVTTTPVANSVQFTATFGPGSGTGTTREAGLFNDPTSGTMSNRVVFATPLVKLSYQTINIIWLVTFNN